MRHWCHRDPYFKFKCLIRSLSVWSHSVLLPANANLSHYACSGKTFKALIAALGCWGIWSTPGGQPFFCVLTPILIQPETQTTGCCFHSPTQPCYARRRDFFPPLVDTTKVEGDPDLFHSARLSDYNVVKTPACIPFQAWNPDKTKLLTLAKSNSRLALLVEQIGCVGWD